MEQLKDSELCKYCAGCEQMIRVEDIHYCKNFVRFKNLQPFYNALKQEKFK